MTSVIRKTIVAIFSVPACIVALAILAAFMFGLGISDLETPTAQKAIGTCGLIALPWLGALLLQFESSK